MATGPHPTGSGPKQPARTGQGEGAYFEGEGHQPFDGRATDVDSREAEAVVDDLLGGLLGTGNPPPHAAATPGGTSSPAAAGTSAGDTAAASPDGTAGASGTSRGSAAQAPGAGRMG